ncbi:putative membrane protein [hydrothermal vent metagenome]|uniref:Putative membrane protein n=1 Tax=hydrothermal vent metagenome TaxID=652676 RepID=A0A3B0WZL9_9ZZZZ
MRKIRFKPASRLLKALIPVVLTGLASSIWPSLEGVWLIMVLFLLLFALLDLWRVSRIAAPQIKRTIAGAVSVGVTHNVQLYIKNTSKMNLCIDVYDHFPEQLPEGLEIIGLPRRLYLDADEFSELSYSLKPLQRGTLNFQQVECLVLSPSGLWQYQHRVEVVDKVKVYPDYAPVIEYALLATENHLSMMGILKHRRRGQGMDFHQLREFREGDSIKQIDWKASSRMRKMIAREYQDERDQQIIVMMDCGHRMLAQDGGLSHFDHSLNALLLLAYVALKQGDSVGVSTFSHDDRRWIKPVKGVANINHLLNGIFDLQPGSAAPDYSSGARDLIVRQRKRSLVLILSNLRDDDHDDLQSAVQLLKKHHKVVVASLQEQAIVDQLEKPVINLDDALTTAATHAYQSKRELLVRKLRSSGITTLDVLPENLALLLTNTYLDLKSSGQI